MAYVHGQLDESEKAALERSLFTDAEAASALQQMQDLHGFLQEHLPVSTAQDNLVERLLEEHEREHPELGLPAPGRMVGWSSRHWVAWAAVFPMLLVGLQVLLPQPDVRWGQPHFAITQFRGVQDDDNERLNAWYGQFREQVEAAYQEVSQSGSSMRWKLQVVVEAVALDEYRIQVQGVDGQQGERRWELFVADLEDLEDKTAAWAAQVGRDLASLSEGP